MPEAATEAAPAEDGSTPAGPPAPEAPNPEQQELDLGDAGKKAIKAEREARAAAEKNLGEATLAVAALQDQIKQFEDRDKTEDQKRQDAFDAAKAAEQSAIRDAAEARHELARYQVGVEKGLSPTLIGRLQGTTPEELSADADRLIEEIGSQAKPRKPQPDPTLGRGAAAGQSTADQFAAAMNSLL